jgi:uncharacterized protein (TIGR00730 family)
LDGVIANVTVYCSSREKLDDCYYQAGAMLGRAIAANGWKLVYGGNALGLMKTVADAVRAAGGKVVGITPQLFVDSGCDDKDCEELIVTPCMRQRKELLEARGDAFVTLPGGIGTFEELFEILAAKSLKLHNKPIVLLNTAGYFDPLIQMLEHGIEHRFISTRVSNLYHVATTAHEAIAYLLECDAETATASKLPSGRE